MVKTLKKKRRSGPKSITTQGGYPFVLYSGPKPDIMMPGHIKQYELKKAEEELRKVQEDLDKAEREQIIQRSLDPRTFQGPGSHFWGPRLFERSSPYPTLGPRPKVGEEIYSPWGF